MFEVLTTDEFDQWLLKLADEKARTRIASRVARLGFGNPGDVKPIGEGLSEMRVSPRSGLSRLLQADRENDCCHPVWRNKSTQDKDIKRAKQMAAEL